MVRITAMMAMVPAGEYTRTQSWLKAAMLMDFVFPVCCDLKWFEMLSIQRAGRWFYTVGRRGWVKFWER